MIVLNATICVIRVILQFLLCLGIRYSKSPTTVLSNLGHFFSEKCLGPRHSRAFDLSRCRQLRVLTEGVLHNAENSETYKNSSFSLAMEHLTTPLSLLSLYYTPARVVT